MNPGRTLLLLLPLLLTLGARSAVHGDGPDEWPAAEAAEAHATAGPDRAAPSDDAPGLALQDRDASGPLSSRISRGRTARAASAQPREEEDAHGPAGGVAAPAPDGADSVLIRMWDNFRHNLFKPLLLFFYLGFLIPVLRVEFEFPYAIYQGLTIYLLLAIGWHGGEELAPLSADDLLGAGGFMLVGFLMNLLIGGLAFLWLSLATNLRAVDRATISGYYGSDSAGTFVTCLGVLATVQIAYDAYMPVMLAVMEIPGCLVALFLVSRLRNRGMDPGGNMPGEPGYDPAAPAAAPVVERDGGPHTRTGRVHDRGRDTQTKLALEKIESEDDAAESGASGESRRRLRLPLSPKTIHEVFLNPGLVLLFGGIAIGFIGGLQGPSATRADDAFFVSMFQGMLCLFLLEMGMTASRRLKDLKTAGAGFIAFALIAPNVFATLGMSAAHIYSLATGTPLELGTYVLFSVLCASASYIAVPAVQRLAIPEASPTLPLAASLGLTFSYNVTVGIPIYIELAGALTRAFPA